ncbi:MAG: DoxX family protein [Nakamurella sp.]
MNVVLWVVAGVLAAAFLASGLMKITRSKKQLADSGMGWTENFSDSALKGIGALEVLGALGLILPGALGVAPVLVPVAATGLALVMIGAIVVHARRKESQLIIVNVVLLALAAFVAWGRFGPYAF